MSYRAIQTSQRFCLEAKIVDFLLASAALDPLQFFHDLGLDQALDEIFVLLPVEEGVDGLLGELERLVAHIFRSGLGAWL